MTPGLAAPVSFTVRRGEIFGLTGQIGSGSSTVVRALAGLAPITGGRVELDGEPMARGGRRKGIRRGIAYASPDRKRDGMFPGRSIQENLSAPWLNRIAARGWISRGKERAQTRAIANTFTIDAGRLESPVNTLSGGNQQKVTLAKWLGIRPIVLLLEEPTRGVDVGARAEVYRHLRALCAEGLTVIVASSDTEEILGLADTIAPFYRGGLRSIRPYSEWSEHDLTREVMHSDVVA
jgi:ABC-type sugar transport system ATPase subunit